jgi:hypothetical protein
MGEVPLIASVALGRVESELVSQTMNSLSLAKSTIHAVVVLLMHEFPTRICKVDILVTSFKSRDWKNSMVTDHTKSDDQ